MRSLILTLLTVGAVSLGFFGSVSSAHAADTDHVVIVDFDVTNVDEATVEELYSHLRRIVSDGDSMEVTETGGVSMDDMLLMAGCDASDPACLAMLGDFIDGDRLLFGSMEQQGEELKISMVLFNFETGEIAREITDQSLSVDAEWFSDGLEAVVYHFMHGKTASLTVSLPDDPEARVRVNGEAVGTGTTTVDEVAPGEVVVMVMASDGTEKTQRLLVRHNESAEIELSFDPSVAEVDAPATGDPGPSVVPGLAASGVGVASLIFGFVAQSQLSSARSEANTMASEHPNGFERDEQATRANELQSDMNRAHTMRYIGWSGGAIGLGAGSFLIFRALTAGPSADDGGLSQRSLDLDVGASSDGINAGIRFGF